jgi:CheY-specific phosphatase CheX
MNEIVLTALAQVAEQMGFLTPTGPGEAPPPDAVVMSVSFSGPAQGRVAVAATQNLIEALARNLLALDPDAVVAEMDCRDALAELVNVVAGNVLPQALGDGEYHLGVPAVSDWPVTAGLDAGLECAEGQLAACIARN